MIAFCSNEALVVLTALNAIINCKLTSFLISIRLRNSTKIIPVDPLITEDTFRMRWKTRVILVLSPIFCTILDLDDLDAIDFGKLYGERQPPGFHLDG